MVETLWMTREEVADPAWSASRVLFAVVGLALIFTASSPGDISEPFDVMRRRARKRLAAVYRPDIG